jgi:hypothetical protein
MEEGTAGEWRRLHNVELHNLYTSTNIIRLIKSMKMKWAGHVTRSERWEMLNNIFIGKSEWKIALERPGGRWEILILGK